MARRAGLAWLATLLVGIVSAVLLGQGIDINLSADVEAVATAMLTTTTPEAKTVVALVDPGVQNVTLSQQPSVVYVASPPVDANSTAVAPRLACMLDPPDRPDGRGPLRQCTESGPLVHPFGAP